MNNFFQPQPPPPEHKLWLYHITSWRNLPQILSEGGLWCPRELENRNLRPINSAHDHIQARRAKKKVTVSHFGTLHDYVPWGFAPHSPMLCAIARNRLENQQVEQSEMVHLVSSLAFVEGLGLSWAFTDGHAAVAFSEFFDSKMNLESVDWALMKEEFWNNTPDDGDRTRRRQAEFLIHSFAPWGLMQGIGVMNSQTVEKVQEILAQAAVQIRVEVKQNWYF